eukprot:11918214-Heterocapsa_arctica.AAC.1
MGAARKAFETAEKQLCDSYRELADVAALLEGAEAEVAAALLKEEERKANLERDRRGTADRLARLRVPHKAQEETAPVQASPAAVVQPRPLPSVENWDPVAAEQVLEELRKKTEAMREAKKDRERQEEEQA